MRGVCPAAHRQQRAMVELYDQGQIDDLAIAKIDWNRIFAKAQVECSALIYTVTDEDIDAWMAENVKVGAKRDSTLVDCREMMLVPHRRALAARNRLPEGKKRKRGKPKSKT